MPSVSSKNPTIRRTILANMLQALAARPAAALFTSPVLFLFTAGPLPLTTEMTLAEFTEATFVDYSPEPVVLAAIINLDNGNGVGSVFNFNFVSGGGAAENILGYGISDAAGVIQMAEYFESAIPIAALGDYIDLNVIIPLAFVTPTGA